VESRCKQARACAMGQDKKGCARGYEILRHGARTYGPALRHGASEIPPRSSVVGFCAMAQGLTCPISTIAAKLPRANPCTTRVYNVGGPPLDMQPISPSLTYRSWRQNARLPPHRGCRRNGRAHKATTLRKTWRTANRCGNGQSHTVSARPDSLWMGSRLCGRRAAIETRTRSRSRPSARSSRSRRFSESRWRTGSAFSAHEQRSSG
jgi:hypothetical protein